MEFQTFSSRQRTGSLNLAGTNIQHCSPAQIMNPQRASTLWQFANRSFLHSTSWKPFTHPGRMYPWVIIKLIYDQSLSAANKRQDTSTHLSILRIGDHTIGLSTRELATIPGTNRLPGNTTRQELERRSIMKVRTRHSGKAGRLLAEVVKRVDGGPLLILRTLITILRQPIRDQHIHQVARRC